MDSRSTVYVLHRNKIIYRYCVGKEKVLTGRTYQLKWIKFSLSDAEAPNNVDKGFIITFDLKDKSTKSYVGPLKTMKLYLKCTLLQDQSGRRYLSICKEGKKVLT
jgi:hypothetical protein